MHDDLSQERTIANGAASVLSVSEIGLPVEDVLQFSTQVKEQLGVEPYPLSRPASEKFGFLGDASGQLVVVKLGHAWMPTETVRATVAPMQLTISGLRAQQIQLSPYPYKGLLGPRKKFTSARGLCTLSAATVCQRRPPNEHLIGSVAAICMAHSADKGEYRRCSIFLALRCVPDLKLTHTLTL